MELSTWLLFTSIALLTTFSPGPAILLAITNSLRFGLRASFYSTLGNELGLLLISSIVILGLGTVLIASTTLFLLLKIIGAAYLIYLGIRQWKFKEKLFSQEKNKTKYQIQSHWVSLTQGFFVATTNPKAILFFSALFPQFINIDRPLFVQFSILIATFSFLSICALMLYAFLAHHSKKWFNKNTRLFSRLLGGLFITLGMGILITDIRRSIN